MSRTKELDLTGALGTATRTAADPGVPEERLRVPGLTVLWHPDPRRVGERVALTDLASGRSVGLSRRDPGFAPPQGGMPRPLGDLYLSRRPLELVAAGNGSVRLVRAGSPTPVEVDGLPLDAERAVQPDDLEAGVVLLLADRVVLLFHLVDPGGSADLPSFGMIGESSAMLTVRREIARIAPLEVPVLLRGATGTGKELVALALHRAGKRRERAFVPVNLAAIPSNLAASELFGAVRGAYTGAGNPRPGLFRHADGGTLFLDEIGEAPPEVQASLLRALEEGQVRPLGSDRPVPVDVRLIAATDRDLEGAIFRGDFRAPLLHRLAGYEIRLPPLAERREDLGRLLVHFLSDELTALERRDLLVEARSEGQPLLPGRAVARLAACSWPGNVRQLAHAARRLALTVADGDLEELRHTLERLVAAASREARADEGGERSGTGGDGPRAESGRDATVGFRSPEEVSEKEMLEALRANRWHLKRTAEALGVSRPSLYDLISRSPKVRTASELGREEIAAALAKSGGDVDAMVEELQVSKRGLKRRMTALGFRGGE